MPNRTENLQLSIAEAKSYYDQKIREAMEPPTWVLRARESDRPEVREQAHQWWSQQFHSTEPLRKQRDQIMRLESMRQELEDPTTIPRLPTTT